VGLDNQTDSLEVLPMKWKDSEEKDNSEVKKEKEYFDEEDIATWEDGDGNIGSPTLTSQKRASSIWIGIVIVAVFAGLVIFFMPKFLATDESSRILALEAKLKSLEDQMVNIADVDEKVSRIWEQAQAFEKFKQRFDRTDASMSLRMDHLATSLDALQKKLASLEKSMASKPVPKSTKAVATTKSEKPGAVEPKKTSLRYHTVSKGENLFRISQQYNLKVEELLRMNKLPANAVIKPGQKLIVGNID
jgi:hypothetical protein